MRARVWNDNTHPHVEMFREQKVTIPPHAFVEMDYEDAVDFKNQFTIPVTDGEKNPIEKFYKKIRVEKTGQVQTVMPLICHATGQLAANAEELAKMNAEHAGKLDADSAKQLDDAAKLRSENDDLKARLAALESGSEEKRGPGRPRKQA